jgi:hypothetical protein
MLGLRDACRNGSGAMAVRIYMRMNCIICGALLVTFTDATANSDASALSAANMLPAWLTYASLATAALSFVLTYWNYSRTALRSMRPVLVIVYENDAWHIQNVGNGPALDVLVAQKIPNGPWIRPVRIPPQSKDGGMHLHWLNSMNDKGIGARYRDVEGRWYTSTCANDLTALAQGDKLQEWTEAEIGRHWAPDITKTHGP